MCTPNRPIRQYAMSSTLVVSLLIQKIFFQSPQLRSFSLVIHSSSGTTNFPMHTVRNFQLSGQERFPPLVQLKLDGYYMQTSERVLWRNKMDWPRLTSLTLIRAAVANIFLMLGVVRNLKVLRMQDESMPRHVSVGTFIRSFTTLEQIELVGGPANISIDDLIVHPNLESIIMHSHNPQHMFSVSDINYLDAKCPRIKFLELSFNELGERVSSTSSLPQIMTE